MAKGEKKSTVWTENNHINELRLVRFIAECTYNDLNIKKKAIDTFCTEQFLSIGIVLSRDAIKAKRKCILESELVMYALSKLREDKRKQQELDEEQMDEEDQVSENEHGSSGLEEMDDEDGNEGLELERIDSAKRSKSVEKSTTKESYEFSSDYDSDNEPAQKKATVETPKEKPKAVVAPKKSYGITRGDAVDFIIGVKKDEHGDELEALVKYKNGNDEFVPTLIVAELAPKDLIQYYESRLRFLQA